MKRSAFAMLTAAAMLGGASELHAQTPYVTYYQPAAYQPTTVYYSPGVTTSAYTVASPVVVSSPVPTVTYYRAPVVSYYPAAPVITRYRPILGNTVVRYPYRFGAPVDYYP